MNPDNRSRVRVTQLPLFDGGPAASSAEPSLAASGGAPAPPDELAMAVPKRRALVNPHLLVARQLSRRIRRLPDHSPEETRTGLAICQALKAYLDDQTERTH